MSTSATDTQRAAISPREQRGRRAARWRWAIGLLVALAFHVTLAALTRIQVAPKPRADVINPRFHWVGDKAILEEDTLRGQQLTMFDDTPLFLVTSQNYAGRRLAAEDSRPPAQIFGSFAPVLVMPLDRSPPGLVMAPTDRTEPVAAVQAFRWPYFSRFGRDDPVVRTFEPRRARLDVHSARTGSLVLSESLAVSSDRETPAAWPDWQQFDIYVSVSDAGRLSEPLMLGGGSGSDEVDRFMRDYVRRQMRLDLRLGPGSYRIVIGP